jgi:hypothetical protein
VTLCRYIIVLPNTSPVPGAATDFGEIAPVIVRTGNEAEIVGGIMRHRSRARRCAEPIGLVVGAAAGRRRTAIAGVRLAFAFDDVR